MDSERLRKRANDIDWSAYRGVEYYRPEAVPVAFRERIDLQETADPVS